MAKKHRKPVSRKAKIKRMAIAVLNTLCILVGLAFIIYNIETALTSPSENEVSAEEIDLPSERVLTKTGLSILSPVGTTSVSLDEYPDECVYLAKKTVQGLPDVAYFVLQTKVPEENLNADLSLQTLPESVDAAVTSVCKTMIKGGVVSPAYEYAVIGVNGHTLVSANGEIKMVAATEKKVYTFPDGVELDTSTGMPKGNKPNGTPWKMSDAKVSTTSQATDASCKVKIMTSRYEDEYITVAVLWNPKLCNVNDEQAQGLVTQAAISIEKE